ncbi:hypothetical protein BACCIP111895_02910 [Neobacillus rhizosphaerae]|uniref:YHYH domain-containing protein n=1 Tax=Neobacillus rhizosphaerae TaxID=2880965 RepID=A0ABN8KQ03_9BACI|nr:hypothetical protein BACCIP111895_02910 [Neobacillus rhizosphaerae]
MGGHYHHYNKGELFQEETKNQYINNQTKEVIIRN